MTQTAQHGLPVDNMNFDGHKIINLKKATDKNDAAALSNLIMSNYYLDQSTADDNILT
ncbi:hypothetical protein AGMMS50222_10350 [Endomicrobiia bacterium]|nr:hypothetical protein AGMMS49556_09060 [Endomicrobiia bacterium]GHT71178.1 hypothetical protein AGMMS49950_07360 [Endomicrobiia bacterium]GHT77014.1 hypothetical protein AGMMS50222_10350 [Endomicrobiia bacterium]